MKRLGEFWGASALNKVLLIGGAVLALGCVCFACLGGIVAITPTTATATPQPSSTIAASATATKTITSTAASTETITSTVTATPTRAAVIQPTVPAATAAPTQPATIAATAAPTNPPTAVPTTGERVRTGALCVDGTTSGATGSGACSGHGGVQCWYYSDGTCTKP